MKLSGRSVFCAALGALTGFAILPAAEATPVVWTAPSLHRVGMSDAPTGNTEARLAGARGESESFQIVANGASAGLSNVNVTVSDLRGPNGQTISRNSFTLYREKYMQVT